MPRRGMLVGVAIAAVAGTLAAGLLLERSGDQPSPAAAKETVTTGSASPPTSDAPETIPVRPTVPAGIADLTVPERGAASASPLPGDGAAIEAAPNEGQRIGSIEIPKIALVSYMFEGVQLTTLDRGPGHWPGTAQPGQPGNVVLAGHRTSMNAPFADLDKLAPGDEVILRTTEARFVYDVTSTEIVDPSALWIADQTEEPTATLFACHPKGSISQRIVVHLELHA